MLVINEVCAKFQLTKSSLTVAGVDMPIMLCDYRLGLYSVALSRARAKGWLAGSAIFREKCDDGEYLEALAMVSLTYICILLEKL